MVTYLARIAFILASSPAFRDPGILTFFFSTLRLHRSDVNICGVRVCERGTFFQNLHFSGGAVSMSQRLLIAKSVIPVLAPVFPAQLFILFLSLSLPLPSPFPLFTPPPLPRSPHPHSMENEMNLSFIQEEKCLTFTWKLSSSEVSSLGEARCLRASFTVRYFGLNPRRTKWIS